MKEILYEKKHIATLSKEERLGKMWEKKKHREIQNSQVVITEASSS